MARVAAFTVNPSLIKSTFDFLYANENILRFVVLHYTLFLRINGFNN